MLMNFTRGLFNISKMFKNYFLVIHLILATSARNIWDFPPMITEQSSTPIYFYGGLTTSVRHAKGEDKNSMSTSLPSTTTKAPITSLTECEVNSPVYGSDISPTFTKTIKDILEKMRSALPRRNDYHSTPYHEAQILIPTNLTVDGMNGSVSFSDIKIAASFQNSPNSLTCEFSQYLKVQKPLKENKLVFYGKVRVNNPSGFQTGNFDVTFNDMTLSIIQKWDFSTVTDIEYKNFTIGIKTNSEDELIVIRATDELIRVIKSYLKSSVKSIDVLPEWYSNEKKIFSEIFGICMHPKSSISQRYPDFAVSEKDYYYVMNGYSTNSISLVNFQMSEVHLNGMSNFKSLTINVDDNRESTFVLSIENLHGYTDWSYTSGDTGSTILNTAKFFTPSITITGSQQYHSYNNYYPVNTFFEPILKCVKSNDSLTSFAQTIITERLKEIIKSALVSLIQKTNNQYYY